MNDDGTIEIKEGIRHGRNCECSVCRPAGKLASDVVKMPTPPPAPVEPRIYTEAEARASEVCCGCGATKKKAPRGNGWETVCACCVTKMTIRDLLNDRTFSDWQRAVHAAREWEGKDDKPLTFDQWWKALYGEGAGSSHNYWAWSRRVWTDATTEAGKFIVHLEADLDRVTAERDGLVIKLRAADKMAMVVDDYVDRKVIDARSAIADARLDYGEPFKYEHGPSPTPPPKVTP